MPIPRVGSNPRRYLRRGGYQRKDHARRAGSKIAKLLDVPDRDDAGGRQEIIMIILRSLKFGTALPSIATVQERYRQRRPLAPMPTLAEWLDYWLPSKHHLAPNTRNGYETHIRLYLKPHLGHHPLDRIRTDHIRDMLELIDDENELIALARTSKDPDLCVRFRYRRRVGPATKRGIVACLRAALNAAISRQIITFNPAAHVGVEQTERQRPVVWTPALVRRWIATRGRPSPVMVWTAHQTGAFLDYAEGDPLDALFQLMAYRGPRRGEACGLSWFDIDFSEHTAEIWRQLLTVRGELVWAKLKTPHSRRTLALDEVTVGALRRHRQRQEVWKTEAGDAWEETGLVFTTKLGAPLRPERALSRFRELTDEAGLPPIRLHDLRHGAATLLLASGTDVKIVQETLGHSRYSTTMDVYTSVLPRLFHESARAVAEIVPRAS